MSLTNGMKSLRVGIDNSHEKRALHLGDMKTNVFNMKSDFYQSRKRMSENTRQTLDCFMSDLSDYNQHRIENGNEDKKLRTQKLGELKTNVFNMKSDFYQSRKRMSENTRQALDCFKDDLNVGVYSLLKSFRMDMEGANREWNAVKRNITDAKEASKNVTPKAAFDVSNISEEIISYIDVAEDGRKPNEVREFIKNINDGIDSDAFVQTLIDDGLVARYQFRYYLRDKKPSRQEKESLE